MHNSFQCPNFYSVLFHVSGTLDVPLLTCWLNIPWKSHPQTDIHFLDSCNLLLYRLCGNQTGDYMGNETWASSLCLPLPLPVSLHPFP